jgi:predicted Zn finger-like uncharacterized protein
MPLSVVCPECGARYNVPDKLAGKRAKCKKCGGTIPIPAPAAAESDIGFAPDDDPMSAMRDLARESGEDPAPDLAPEVKAAPAARKRAASSIPADWTPESVVIEKEAPAGSRAMEGTGRWARKSGGGLVRKVVWLLVIAGIAAGGWYVYTNYSGKAGDIIASATGKLKGNAKKQADDPDAGTKQAAPAPSENETKRAESAEHLRKIFSAVSARAARDGWNWPADLKALENDGSIPAEQLKSPFGPAFASADYVYKPFTAGMPAGPEVVIAYDNAEYSTGEGAGVLFGSGEVRWLDKAAVEAALQQSESARASATQQREQQVAAMRAQQQQAAAQSADTANPGGSDPKRMVARGDVAERIKAGSQGMARDVIDVAVRRGTEQLVRPLTPSSFVAVLVRGAQGDSIEVFDGKSQEPVQSADFPSEQQFRTNPGAYALSPDGKLVARLATFPKLAASVYSFEKKGESVSIELDSRFGEPTLVGFMGNDRLLVRWHKLGKHGLEVWDAKTGKRGRQIDLFDVQPPPAPGSETISPDGKTYALVNRANNLPARSQAAREQTLQVLLYDVIGAVTQPRRFQIPVLNNVPGVQAAGLAFSPDKTRLALLLVDPQGRAVVVTWPVATGKPLPEKVLAEKVDPPHVGQGRARALDWVADGRALLVAGKMILNADTGDTLAVLDAGNVHGQAVTNDSTVHLAHGQSGQLEGLAVVPLNEGKFPEKPGLPNRAIAAPTR